METHPSEMDVEELELVYGKPRKEQVVNAVLAVAWNENHDQVTFGLATQDMERVLLPITQVALKEFVRLAGEQVDQTVRPKLN